MKFLVTMNARSRIYLIIAIAIGIIFLMIAIVQNQANDLYGALIEWTEEEVKSFLEGYTTGFPRPWEV